MARENAIPCINAILFSPTINTEPLFLLNNAGDTDPVSPNHAATSAGREIIVVESVMVVGVAVGVVECVRYVPVAFFAIQGQK